MPTARVPEARAPFSFPFPSKHSGGGVQPAKVCHKHVPIPAFTIATRICMTMLLASLHCIAPSRALRTGLVRLALYVCLFLCATVTSPLGDVLC